MMKLIHIVRGIPDNGTAFNIFTAEGEHVRMRTNPLAILPRQLHQESSNFQKESEFVLVEEADADATLAALATANPGYEVRVYGLEQVAQCPAAPMVVKKVSAHGVLPGL